MKIVKYNDKIVKYDDGIVIKPEPPVEPTYSTHSLKYSSNNCVEACGSFGVDMYCLPDVITLSVDDVIYTDIDLITTTLSGYYSNNNKCYLVDGDGIIVSIEDC